MAQTALAPQLQGLSDSFKKNGPENIRNVVSESNKNFQASFRASQAIQVGTKLPAFDLLNALGEATTITSILANGPILISFYRGSWCPFCSLELRALQQRLADFEAKGVTLVAISPELPDTSLSTVEKNNLKFVVLSDVANKFARELGLAWKMPEELRPVFKNFGHDLIASNGDDSFEVPVPATLLVDKQGVVRNTYINPDYTKRLEPSIALEWVDKL